MLPRQSCSRSNKSDFFFLLSEILRKIFKVLPICIREAQEYTHSGISNTDAFVDYLMLVLSIKVVLSL